MFASCVRNEASPHNQIFRDAKGQTCRVTQAAANRERIQQALVDLHAERELATKVAERRLLIAREIEMILEMDPEVGTASLAERTGLSFSTVQRYVRKLRQERGIAA